MLTLKQILAQIQPQGLVCVRGFKGCVLSHSDSTERTNTLFSRPGCSGPTHFQSASMQHFPLRSCGRRILNYLDDWMILAQSLDTLISHIDSLLIHLESLRLQVNMSTCREHSRPRLSRDRSGDESLPLARSRGDESLPLVRSRGDESPLLARSSRGQFVFPAPFQARQLCSVEGFSEICSDSGRRIQRYVIWDYYTCARCSYG